MIKYRNRAYTRCPIPNYDIRGTELWLEKMAMDGYILRKDGFTGEFVGFDIATPKNIRYRLDAAEKGTKLFSPGDGEPDPEQVELSREFGWEYTAKRSDFFIYASDDPDATEFHTDPQIQAMALKAVRARSIDQLISTILWPLLLPLGGYFVGFFSILINFRTWFVALWLFMMFLDIVNAARNTARLIKVRRQILTQGFAQAFTDINKKGIHRHLWDFLRLSLAIAVVCILITYANDSVLGTNEIPIKEYSGDIPFATMADFSPEGSYSSSDYGFGNTVTAWRDLVSPVNIVWDELGRVKCPDGTIIEGGLDIYYHETVSPFVAHNLAKELHHNDKRSKRYSELDTDFEIAGLDYFAVYSDELHFPVVIMQKGNICVKTRFYQTGRYNMPLEEWAEIIHNSIFTS